MPIPDIINEASTGAPYLGRLFLMTCVGSIEEGSPPDVGRPWFADLHHFNMWISTIPKKNTARLKRVPIDLPMRIKKRQNGRLQQYNPP